MTTGERHALELLKAAARTYAVESSGGMNPLLAGARLRLAAKAFAQAETDGGKRLEAKDYESNVSDGGASSPEGRSEP